MSETSFEYTGEDKQKYQIILEVTNDNYFILTIIEQKNREVYSSTYFLNNLNDKLGHIIKLKTIKDFEACCKENIKKKLLVLKPPYKNVINSVWKIVQNKNSNTQTFTLISTKTYNKKISIYNYNNYSKIKDLVEEIKKQLVIENEKCTVPLENKNLDYLPFKENWILDKIYFLKGDDSNKKGKEEDFIKLLESEQTDSG